MYRIETKEYSNGVNYYIMNSQTKKQVATTWKNREIATYLLDALNFYDDCIRCGLYEKVAAKIAEVKLYNEQLKSGNP